MQSDYLHFTPFVFADYNKNWCRHWVSHDVDCCYFCRWRSHSNRQQLSLRVDLALPAIFSLETQWGGFLTSCTHTCSHTPTETEILHVMREILHHVLLTLQNVLCIVAEWGHCLCVSNLVCWTYVYSQPCVCLLRF